MGAAASPLPPGHSGCGRCAGLGILSSRCLLEAPETGRSLKAITLAPHPCLGSDFLCRGRGPSRCWKPPQVILLCSSNENHCSPLSRCQGTNPGFLSFYLVPRRASPFFFRPRVEAELTCNVLLASGVRHMPRQWYILLSAHNRTCSPPTTLLRGYGLYSLHLAFVSYF